MNRIKKRIEDPQALSSIKKLRISASSIESYRACPYRWFVSYALKTNSYQKSLNAQLKGCIAHDVISKFLGEQSFEHKELLGNIEEAQIHLGEIYDSVFNQYLERDFKNVEINSNIIDEFKQLKNKLQNYLYFEAQSFLGFENFANEIDDVGTYAGVEIRYRPDRLITRGDTFIVIDYKLGTGDIKPYWDEIGKIKVQTAIYAKLLEEKINKRCIACLYIPFSNGDKQSSNKVGGAIDGEFLKSHEIHISKRKYDDLIVQKNREELQVENFASYLTMVEEQVSEDILHMQSGIIDKYPGNPKGAYCPILDTCGLCKKVEY
ncbi:MAG: PD-(D/E)XK nuclease family protein [Coriobacteriia bacterium]|nr:PD-(D/E)XK nuclease family protein [Coriobacteriia bacterium]